MPKISVKLVEVATFDITDSDLEALKRGDFDISEWVNADYNDDDSTNWESMCAGRWDILHDWGETEITYEEVEE